MRAPERRSVGILRLTALIVAGVGIVWSLILAAGVAVELRAIAGIVDRILRHTGSCRDRRKNGRGSQKCGFCHEGFSSNVKRRDTLGRGV